MIKFIFSYIFTIQKLNLFKSIIILITYNVGFMAHNPKVAGSDGLKLYEGKFILPPATN